MYTRRAPPGPKECSDPATPREPHSPASIPPSSAPYPSAVSCALPTVPVSAARLPSIPAEQQEQQQQQPEEAPEEEAVATNLIISPAPSVAALI